MTLVKLQAIAADWSCSVKTVQRFAKRHGIKLYPIGPKAIRANREDFDRWVSAEKESYGASRSKSNTGALAQRLGPAKKRKASRRSTAEIVPFPDKGSRPNAA
jgi:hypothetical protein